MATVAAPLSVKLIVNPSLQKSHVFIDGTEWLNVRSFTLHSEAGALTTLSLELVNIQVEVEGGVYLATNSETPE